MVDFWLRCFSEASTSPTIFKLLDAKAGAMLNTFADLPAASKNAEATLPNRSFCGRGLYHAAQAKRAVGLAQRLPLAVLFLRVFKARGYLLPPSEKQFMGVRASDPTYKRQTKSGFSP